MKLDEVIAVSGLPGLYKMAANRRNGLIVEALDSGKRNFASSRNHQFTPLGSIAIFTDDGESIPLTDVFTTMKEQLESNPPVEEKSSNEVLYGYFAKVLPNYDKERVYPGDVRKVIKWFNYLQQYVPNLGNEEEE